MIRPVVRKVDENQPKIVEILRHLVYSVQQTHIIGKGVFDLVFEKLGHSYCAEIKDGRLSPSRRRLTDDEERFWKEWKGHSVLFESVDDVIEFDRKRSKRHG